MKGTGVMFAYRLLKPSRTLAANFASKVVCRREMRSVGASVRTASVTEFRTTRESQ